MSQVDKSVKSVVGVSGSDGGWTGREHFSEIEGRVGDVDSILGTAVVLVDSRTTSLPRDGTWSGVDSFFMYGRKKYFPVQNDLVQA